MKRILIAPLDWGLGHATRCIPIIRLLLESGSEVIVAADKRPYDLLKLEFPQLEFIRFPGYEILYPSKGSMALQMLLLAPKLLRGIKKEHQSLQKIIREKNIDLVISDNRYGLYSDKVKCIFITHQLFIRAPAGAAFLNSLIKRYINKYSECWIPDMKGEENLSGALSHKKNLPENYFFIGPLSRFRGISTATSAYDLVVTLSGPEPQRSIFEKNVLNQLGDYHGKVLVLLGKTEMNERNHQGKHEIVSHLDTTAMAHALSGEGLLVGRSGYSSIMDAVALGKKCVFVPTPGQTEQEYLAKYHAEKGHCITMKQNKFNLTDAIGQAKKIKGFEKNNYTDALLRKKISELLELSETKRLHKE